LLGVSEVNTKEGVVNLEIVIQSQ